MKFRKLSFKLWALIVMIFASMTSMAFDVDYYRLLAQEYFAKSEYSKVIDNANKGLSLEPNDQELKNLKLQSIKKIEQQKQATLQRKKQDADAKAKREQEQHDQRERDQKARAEQELRDRPERLRKVMCHCQIWKDDEERKLRAQHAIAKSTGVIDKVAAHDAGNKIYYIDLTIKHLAKTMAAEGVAEVGCEGRRPSSGWDLPCYDYQMKHAKEIKELR